MKYAQHPCKKCGERTPHKTKGAQSKETDAQGRVTQAMQCVKCKTTTEYLIDRKTGVWTPKT